MAYQPDIFLYVVLGVVLLTLIWTVATYNILVRLRLQCREAWSGIDTELKRRYELIPNLVETVRGYARHEQETLSRVIEARNLARTSHSTPQSQARDENAFVGSLRKLLVLSENYPQLKANEHFLQLQQELANTEDRIQAVRRFYNANVRDFNTRIEVFPSSLIAGIFQFKKKEFFEIDDVAMRRPVSVAL
jgi:LemA protein